MPARLLFALVFVLAVVAAPSAPSSAAIPDAAWLRAQGLDAPVRAKVEAAQYAVRPSGASRIAGERTSHEAMHPAQGLRAVFTGVGIDVARPAAGLEDWRWNMRLVAYGRGAQVAPPSTPTPIAVANRVEYQYGRGLTEWFVNTAGGIEHGFTLAESVRDATGALAPLELVLAVHGDLVPRMTATGDVQFTGAGGQAVLGYRELHAWDADGRVLPSRMAVVSGQVRLVVDDHDARYPVTIDPVVFDSTPLNPSNPKPDDAFGFSVAIRGNYAVIGTPTRETAPNVFKGSVFVFVKDSGGGWTQEAEIFASGGADADLFGASVAISGTTLAVGAPDHNPNGQKSKAGATYIFVRGVVNGVVSWTQQAKLVASDGAVEDAFGSAVALSGDYIAIGAPNNNPGGKPRAGKVYILGRSGVLWTEKAKLPGGEAGDLFGSALAITEGGTLRTLVVGAPGIDKPNGILGGRASVFFGTGTSWPKQADLVPSPNDLTNGAAFGFSVGVSENTAIIGAPGQQVGPAATAGAAYVFTRSGSTWSQQARLVASDGVAGDQFGAAVDIDKDLVVVGAPYRPPSANGQAYLFIRVSTVWQEQTQQLKANPPEPFQFFGFSVSVDGTNIAVGAPFHAAEANQGPAYVFAPTASFAGLWIGLQNSNAVGLRVDLRTEVYNDATLVAEGQINGARTGSSGFTNAILQTVPLEVLVTPFTSYTTVIVSARVSCSEPGHASGVPRLWYNGRFIDTGPTRDAGSRIQFHQMTTRFLRNIDNVLRLNTNPGTQQMFLDISLDSSVPCPQRPFTPFGTFSSELPSSPQSGSGTRRPAARRTCRMLRGRPRVPTSGWAVSPR